MKTVALATVLLLLRSRQQIGQGVTIYKQDNSSMGREGRSLLAKFGDRPAIIPVMPVTLAFCCRREFTEINQYTLRL